MLIWVGGIEREVETLESCSYDVETFREVLSRIQKAVDELNLHSYTNLASWVSSLDKSVSSYLNINEVWDRGTENIHGWS